ncbi:MAG: FHA domain-containing protein [Deltaproteobacteria bacterium]|nr:FHA domain-containing protein [Deltaproteobacteria bacterium]
MNLNLEWNGQASAPALDGHRVTLGGGRQDSLKLDGARPGLLTLERAGTFWTARAAEPANFAGRPFPAHVARLWLPGEPLQVGGLRCTWRGAVASERGALETSVLARQLLGSGQVLEAASPALVCLCGRDLGRRLVLGRHGGVLGRSGQAHLRLLDESISRAHLSFTRGASGWWVEDLGSPNGLQVDGKPWKRAALVHGAVLDLGRVQLRFEAPGEAVARPPQPEAGPPPEQPAGTGMRLENPTPGMPRARDTAAPQRRWVRTAVGLLGAATLLGLAWA